MSFDIGLFIEDVSGYDLAIENGDLKQDGGLETAVSISLFTDARVSDDELPDGQVSKRGWWGDMFPVTPNDKIGSRLWTLERSKRTIETLRLGEDYAKEALQWLIDDGIASTIEVVGSFEGSVSEGKWRLDVNITKPSGNESRFQYAWDQQALIRG